MTPGGVAYVTWPISKFSDLVYIFGTVKCRNFIFGAHIEYDMY